MIEAATEHDRRDEVDDDVPGGAVGLGAVIRIGVGDALANPGHPVVLHRHDDELAIDHAPEAGLEVPDQREVQQAHFEAFDPHRSMLSAIPAGWASAVYCARSWTSGTLRSRE